MPKLTSISRNYQLNWTSVTTNVKHLPNKYSANLNLQTMVKMEQPICWVIFRFPYQRSWRWHEQKNIWLFSKNHDFQENEEVKYGTNLLLPEIVNSLKLRLYKLNPTALIEHNYILRCSYINQKNEEQVDECIEDGDIWDKRLNEIIKDLLNAYKDCVVKFEIGIRVIYKISDVSESSTRNLMLKRCLEIWSGLNREQISRGLLLTETGKKYMDARIANMSNQGVIQKTVQEGWEIVDGHDLKPQMRRSLPPSGVKAAKLRAHQWAKNPSI